MLIVVMAWPKWPKNINWPSGPIFVQFDWPDRKYTGHGPAVTLTPVFVTVAITTISINKLSWDAKIGPLGQLIFLGHLGQQLSFLPCHSISTDNRLMKFPDKTFKFNFNHSPKAINSLITQSACVYLDLLPQFKRILTEIYAGNQYFIIQ
jgi:hypothetical protein